MILFVLFFVVPIAELYVIIRIGSEIGFLNTLGIIVAVAMVGSWLVRREGLRTWTRFNESLASGRVPTREIVDGVLILGAGALLLTPGFLSDIVGVLLLFPPTRAVIRAVVTKRLRPGESFVRFGGFPGGSSPRPSGDVVDVDSTEPKGEL
ncbi:MAG: FxsA family protein [Actinomycetota bacterium]